MQQLGIYLAQSVEEKVRPAELEATRDFAEGTGKNEIKREAAPYVAQAGSKPTSIKKSGRS